MATAFDGAASYCNVPLALAGLSPQQITLSFWMNLSSSSGFQTAAVEYDFANPNGFRYLPYSNSNKSEADISTDGVNITSPRGNVLIRDVWCHIVIPLDGTTSGAGAIPNVYLDGAPQFLTYATSTFVAGTWVDLHDLFLGSAHGPSLFFTGDLFQFAIFPGLLTQAQVQSLYAGTDPLSVAGGPIYYWTLASGTVSTEANLGSAGTADLAYTSTTTVASPTFPLVGPPQSWNLNLTSTNIALSGSNLTATVSGSTASCITIGTEAGTALLYWEIQTSGTGWAADESCGVGLATNGADLDIFLGEDAYGLGFFPNTGGGVYYNNYDNNGNLPYHHTSNLTPTALTAAGGLICVAWDEPGGWLWVKFGSAPGSGGNLAGYWNGDSMANPLTQTGGVAVPSSMIGPAVYPAGMLHDIGDAVTGKFAQSSWAGAAPSGFGPFDAPPGGGHNLPLLGVGNFISPLWTPAAVGIWAGRKLEENPITTRRRLLLPRRR